MDNTHTKIYDTKKLPYNIKNWDNLLNSTFYSRNSCRFHNKGLHLRHLIYDFAIYEIS